MVNTKFGKRLFGLFLALVCVLGLFACQNNDAQLKDAAIKEATEQVEDIYSKIYWDKGAMSQITSNLILNTKTKYENVAVEWESSEPDLIAADGKVTLPTWEDERNVVVQEATEDEPAVKVAPVKLTATITGVAEWTVQGKTYTQEIVKTKEFNFTVKALAEGVKLETIAQVKQNASQYIYEECGVAKDYSSSDSNTVYSTGTTGVVVGFVPNAGFMIHDGTDGIYVYKTVEGLKMGDQVTVFGDVYSYYGSLQFGKNNNVTIDSKVTLQVGEYKEYTPQELETKYSEKLADGSGYVQAGNFGGELISVTGKLVKQTASTSEEYALMDAKTGEIVWIYRGSYTDEAGKQLAAMLDKFVTIRGAMYGRDSRLQRNRILWDGTEIKEAVEPELTDAEKVTLALGSLNVPATAEEDFELSADVTWEIVSGTAIVIENGVAKVTKGEAESVVVLRATATIGSASDSKEFEVKVPAAVLPIITIAEALALVPEDGSYTKDKYYVQAVIVNIENETYGNMTVKDATGELYVYGVYSKDGSKKYGEMEVKPQVGDIVTLYGSVGAYNGNKQMKNAWAVEQFDVISVTEALTIAPTDNTYTEQKYYVRGTLGAIQNEAYGNVDITDGTSTLYVYGIYSKDGVDKYEKLSPKPVEGDDVILLGVLGSYNGKQQLKSGWLVFHLPADGSSVTPDPDPEPDPEPKPEPEVDYVTSVEAGVEYYLSFFQEQNKKYLFPNGEMNGYYGATVEVAENSKKVALEAVEGGYHLYFVGATKTYINIVQSENNGKTYNNIKYEAAPSSVWTFNTEYNTLVTVVGTDTTVYLGTYDQNVTLGASKISYAATSYVAHLYKNAPVYEETVEPEPDPEPKPDPVEGSMPEELAFAAAANKADADSYMKTNFPNWTITGKLGQTYQGYLGFGRSGDVKSAITSNAFSTTTEFKVTAVIKGNGSSTVMTSTLTFELIDKDGNVVATGYANGSTTAAITPVDAKDTTYEIVFTFAEGKTIADASNLRISFAKTVGNIGLKSVTYSAK